VLASSQLATTVALTAGRGRGKSAALGLCMAAAVAHGYANIFVTSPAPSNLRTLFEFLFKGLTALGYDEVSDWSVQRGVGEWKDAVVRVNIFRGHRQTIQYIDPADSHVLGQAELVVVDEAAAIPLALVRNLMGPYLVFLSSTINGYEGTGRSLSLKLIQQLREGASKTDEDDGSAAALVRKSTSSSSKLGAKALTAENSGALGARSLKEVTLEEPIRYGAGDAVEAWLHNLLCLDASLTPLSARGSPHPSTCTLFGINRDALFSYHPASEVFLQRVMALYVAAHYKNSPNDLQLMSDAPAHRLFVLLGPREGNALPEPLAVVQVALEGNIARDSVMRSLARGTRESGDLIPWSMSQQFQDADFAALSGARVVRIAVHPEHARAGYGTRAVECLRAFYAGELLDADALAVRAARDAGAEEEDTFERARDAPAAALDADKVAVRDARRMPALLEKLEERRPEALDWIGVAFGHTPSLFRFWRRAGFVPLYLRQMASDLTGEHTSLMLRPLDAERPSWLQAFAEDFSRRFVSLLTILETAASASRAAGELGAKLELPELRTLLSPFDMKRLDGYANSSLELPIVVDLLPALAGLYFMRRLRAVAESSAGAAEAVPADEEEELKLPALQSAILLAVGLQRKDIGDVERELSLPRAQAGALFVKAVRKILTSLRAIERSAASREMPAASSDAAAGFKPLARSLDDELKLAGDEAKEQRAEADKAKAGVSKLDGLEKYAIRATDGWEEAEAQVARAMQDAPGRNTIVSLRGEARDEASSPASDKGKKRSKSDDAARRGKKHKGK
jgi:N-acetyltransferase 10